MDWSAIWDAVAPKIGDALGYAIAAALLWVAKELAQWYAALKVKVNAEINSIADLTVQAKLREIVAAAEQWAAREGGKIGKEKYQWALAEFNAWAKRSGFKLELSEADIEAAVAKLKGSGVK